MSFLELFYGFIINSSNTIINYAGIKFDLNFDTFLTKYVITGILII